MLDLSHSRPSFRAALRLAEMIHDHGLQPDDDGAEDYALATDCEHGCTVDHPLETCEHGYASAQFTLTVAALLAESQRERPRVRFYEPLTEPVPSVSERPSFYSLVC